MFICGMAHADPPFQRALVIGGGGVAPGVAAGIIAGARAAGFEPDVIIATCGASMGATVSLSSKNDAQALAFLKSPRYHQGLLQHVQIDTAWALSLKYKLDQAGVRPGVLSQLWSGTVLRIPERLPPFLASEAFPTKGPRLILPAARAQFPAGAENVSIAGLPAFKQIYFTDADTARFLNGIPSAMKRLFPHSYLDSKTSVVTGVGMSQAMRASIADPYLVNPALIGRHYYFTGAVDLHPIETAQRLAQEVLVTYPSAPFSHYDALAVSSSFGFDPRQRVAFVKRQSRVKWIDVSGMVYGFDPEPSLLIMVSRIPQSHAHYAQMVENQFNFGYHRAVEAVKFQSKIGNQRGHLRVR